MSKTVPGLSRTGLRLFAVAAVSLGASSARPTLAAIATLAGLLLFTWSLLTDRGLVSGGELRLAAMAAFIVIIASMFSPLSRAPDSIATMRPVLIVAGSTACAVAFVAGTRANGRRLAVALGMLVVLLGTGALAAAEWSSELGTDIYHAHSAAGTALFDGENPYTDAVRFFDGSPYTDEDRIIEGYPYPPVILLTYGLAGAFTDPRLISAIAWIGVIAWVGWRASKTDHGSEAALGVFLLLSTLPIWSLIWYAAWTEPLSLALFVISAATWKKRPLLAAAILGLAIASKQYFVFLVPLVLLHRDEIWLKRVTLVGGTALATLLPSLIVDPTAFMTATVGNLAEIGWRPDTQSIPGLLGTFGFQSMLPLWAWVSTGLLIGAAVGIQSRRSSLFAGGAGVILGSVFIIGLAFANYWVIVAGLFSIATVLDAEDGSVMDRFGSNSHRSTSTVRPQLS